MTTPANNPLATVLTNETDCARSLKELLEQEYTALQGRDTAVLERLASNKVQLAEQLARLESQRCLLMPGAPDSDWQADDEHSALWLQLKTLGTECARMNQVNGGIAELGRRRTERCLQLLHGQDADAETYSAEGEHQRPHSAGRLATA